jgi:transposase
VQRLQRTLEEANIKLDSAISDVIGTSGHDDRGYDCRRDRSGQARVSRPPPHEGPPAKLAEVLRGRVTKHDRFLLRLHLKQIDALDNAIAEIDKEVEANLDPFRPFIPIVTSMPGIAELSARVILAEIGTDMGRFVTARHLISWSGLCPKNDESAGKRRSTRMRKAPPG